MEIFGIVLQILLGFCAGLILGLGVAIAYLAIMKFLFKDKH
jgi:hypothetical protein